ncbi:hypothetical protein AKJ16_DCAP08701, partial [Drosera capensis]
MASVVSPLHCHLTTSTTPSKLNQPSATYRSLSQIPTFSSHPGLINVTKFKGNKRSSVRPVAAVGELSSDSTTYLIAGAVVVALLGTAFPLLFSRKDLCPECDGAGFVRQGSATLRANAARKDQFMRGFKVYFLCVTGAVRVNFELLLKVKAEH